MSSTVRRLGNNDEVLGQYYVPYEDIIRDEVPSNSEEEPRGLKESFRLIPLLVSVLPSWSCEDTHFIRNSFGQTYAPMNLGACIERKEVNTAPGSYIIRSAKTGSRTIVNYVGTEEMSSQELRFACIQASRLANITWWHIEGRNVEAAMDFVRYMRQSHQRNIPISVEVEKPGREGLIELAMLADVVFFSRTWAMHAGFSDLKSFLEAQAAFFNANKLWKTKTLFCTWGEKGAGVCVLDGESPKVIIQPTPPLPPGKKVVDTIGAGDTFVATVIAHLWPRRRTASTIQREESALMKGLEACNQKVCQEGFQNLAPPNSID